ncbi:MAG TPA: SRPBCC family protein [Candidatus Binatia bacterium]|nr:SRPBCC family protein [Candidatus Binatia bacterium]
MKNNRLGWIGSFGLGAVLFYILDPQMGRRRRALVRDKLRRFGHKTLDAIDLTSRDLKNRVLGLAAETRNLIPERDVSDDVLEQRVRSKLGALVSHPGSINVKAENGRITVSGPVLAREIDGLLERIWSVRGVKNIENQLEVHESGESIPGLQGEPGQRKGGQALDIMQTNWSPATRFIAGTFGAATALWGARQLNVLGSAVATFGAAIAARALTNIEFKRLIGAGAGRNAVTVHKIINIAAPVEKVFAFWSNYQNFPRFMSNVRDVRSTGANRSHWVVAGPAGTPVEWDAVVTQYAPNEALGWETTPESAIQHTGIVRFQSNPQGGTRLDIRMSYNPVAGAVGHAVATLFGADPKTEMDQDLARMKTMIETGIPPHDAARKDEAAYTH